MEKKICKLEETSYKNFCWSCMWLDTIMDVKVTMDSHRISTKLIYILKVGDPLLLTSNFLLFKTSHLEIHEPYDLRN